MPICYEISIAVERTEEGGETRETSLPRKVVSENPLTNEQLTEYANNLWQLFIQTISDSDPSIVQRYQRGEGFQVTNVYQC